MKLRDLIIRADASVRMGTGHMMRMLALAQAYAACGGRVTLLVAEAPEALLSRWRAEGFNIGRIRAKPGSVTDAFEIVASATGTDAEWVIVDGYQFDASFQAHLRDAGYKVLFVDDYRHADHYYADVVLNQNDYADPEWYAQRESSTTVLAGANYILLRREFWPWRQKDRWSNGHNDYVLITMGGSDSLRVTQSLLPGLAAVCEPDVNIAVAAGGANPHRQSLERMIRELPARIVLHYDLQDMASLMHRSTIAIASAGTTAWELAFMGVPSLLVASAENQEPVAEALAQRGAAWSLGHVTALHTDRIATGVQALLSDARLRKDMSLRGMQLIDGYGVSRVCSVLTGSGLWLRPAVETDKELLWHWANDPLTRRNAFHPETISWDAHLRWFRERIQSGESLCYIGLTVDNTAVGQARFDETESGAVITVSVDASLRGRGHGTSLIREAVRRAFAERSYRRIVAYVKPENTASRRAFASAGFRQAGTDEVNGYVAVRMVKDREACSHASQEM